jgi:hypothetical protein
MIDVVMVVIAIVVVGVLEVTVEIEIHLGLDISQIIDAHCKVFMRDGEEENG